ncbi:ATP-dependent DNA helicase, UvrD family [Skeletonema marinoi]|uniref:DNA 3'-5' helicase n=1 Tax=Skeletonema marinoi TaxID=267567 RepID=A0AAD8YBC8_9STRA|nr:ATP-dependent DNA helicase, UvrD family [Skeletonema marinoi]
MAPPPKKSGAADAKKSGGGIERFLHLDEFCKDLSPTKSRAIAAKNKSMKRPPPKDGATESPSKRELFPAPAAKKKKTNQRQKSMEAMGFSAARIQKNKSPSKISFSMTDEVKKRVEQGIEQSLFERDAITQQRVVECPPNIPLSVRACAGTGKTHTMVQRAISFINVHHIDPKNILIVTFSKLATEEVIERVTRAFGRETDLPTIKTFHALAYSWVCRSWKHCGLGQRPSVLNPKSGEMDLMKQVFERILDSKRLERCARKLKLEEESLTWDDVLKAFQTRHQELYDELAQTAKVEAEKIVKKRKKKKDMKPEECDLESRWIGKKSNNRCKESLELVRKARLGSHDYNEYPFEDSQVWQLYDRLQRETGRIDFDTMLLLFAENVLGDERLAKQFHERYTHVVVDEYQDNSQMQALMLKRIVKRGCLTVVGDDDQCIYEFRGASPGNFDRLKEEFAKKNIAVQEEVLIDNHRSSKNVLTVASAFLEGDKRRHPKTLRPIKPEGPPVEVWECSSQTQQAKQIVAGMIKRHEDDRIRWKEMAALFRCLKMGGNGSLTTHLQKELAEKKVPFVVVGGKSIFERASVRDLVAYLQLSIRRSPNDEAFTRSINQPPRRLPKDKVIPIIKEFLDGNTMRKEGDKLTSITFLQEAAKVMVEKNVGLTTSRHNALSEFLAQIGTYQGKLNIMSLPDLLKYLWKETGLSEFYKTKNKVKASDNDEDDESDDEDDQSVGEKNKRQKKMMMMRLKQEWGVKPALPKSVVTSPVKARHAEAANPYKVERVYYPEEISLLIELAAQHVDDWNKREEILRDSKSIPSLLDLTRKVVLENRAAYALESLPDHIVDEIVLAPAALGRSVVDEFLAGIMLQHSTVEDQPHAFADDNKVTISSVHRAKGLEWSDVYVPYLNEEFLPTSCREGEVPLRHVSNCNAIIGGKCDKECAAYFASMAAEERGGPEERHLNEERRLAHVAATRAKEKLVFLSVDGVYSRKERKFSTVSKSSFLDNIREHVTIVNKR